MLVGTIFRCVRIFLASSLVFAGATVLSQAKGAAPPAAQPAPPCLVVSPPVPASYPDWNSDDGYNLSKAQDGTAVRIRISADIVRINNRNFQSLVREIDKAIPNISAIVVDARKIILNAPLSFETTKLTFLSDEFEFGPLGKITLTAAAPAGGDGIRIITRKLTFDDMVSKPFQVTPSLSPLRSFEIVAASVKSGGNVLTAAAAGTAVWKRTVGSYLGPAPVDNSWHIVTDPSSSVAWFDVFRSEMFWPMYSSAKLEKFHARAPYDPQNKSSLQSTIAGLKPTFEQWSGPKPLIEVQRVEGLMRLNLDSFGKSAAYAPRIDISTQLANAKARLAEAKQSSGYMTMLTNLVVAASERKQIDAVAVKQVADKIEAGDAAIITIQADIDSSLARIDQLKQTVASINTLIAQRRTTLASETASDVKRAQDAAKIKLGTNVLATGVAIGCMFIPGAQPAGIAIATGITVTGGLIYANNTGGITTATIAEVAAKSADFYSKMSAISSSWEKFKAGTATVDTVLKGGTILAGDPPKAGDPDTRKPLTKVQATKQWGEAAGALASSIDAAYKSLDVAKPTALAGTDREKQDFELNDLLSQTGAANKEASDLAASITAKADLLTVTMQENYKAGETKSELLSASVVNDQEIERWKANSLALWGDYVAATLRDILTLRRSYFFETGALPDLPSDVLQYPEELLAFMRADVYDPTGAGTNATPPDVLRAHLTSERDKFLVSMQALVNAVDRGIVQSLAKRTEADVYRLTFSFRADSANQIEKRFVQAINSQLAQQIGFKRDPSAFEPLFLPIELPKTVSPFPQRFVDAKVTKLVFRNKGTVLNQSGLTFTVLHPGYGKIYRGNACYMFDLRDSSSDNVIAKTTDLNAINEQWAQLPAQRINISNTNNFYTYYPAQAPLSLATVISGNNWVNPPEIQEIDIGIEVMQ